MRILVVNIVTLNVGDAAILLGELEAIREAFGPDTEVIVAEPSPEAARRLYRGIEFVHGLHSRNDISDRWPPVLGSFHRRKTRLAIQLLPRFPRLAMALFTQVQRAHVRRIASCDAVVSSGGTYFVEHYNLATKADEMLAAQVLGIPTFFYTQSMGPFERPTNRALMANLLQAARDVFVRDERSQRNVIAAGADPRRVSVHADAAFALAVRAMPLPTGRTDVIRVAISVRDWPHSRQTNGPVLLGPGPEQRYRRAIADAARDLARSGVEVTFMSTCQGMPEFSDDSAYAQAIVDEFLREEPCIHVDRCFRAPDRLVETLREFDAVIATRMHFAILALLAITPVVAIAYEFKSQELMGSVGLARFVISYEEVNGEWLHARVREVLDAAPAILSHIAAQVERLRVDAAAPAHMIRRALADGARQRGI